MLQEEGEVLRVHADPSARKWMFVIGVVGTAVVGWLFLMVILADVVGTGRQKVSTGVAVGGYCAAVVVAVGIFWNFTGGRCADAVFDRRAGVFRGKFWTRAGWRRDVTGPLDRIASLQICCREIEVEDDENYQTYELNIVLADPPGARLGLGSHADAREVQRDATRLAEFLDCGVLLDCPGLRPFPTLPETMRHRKGKRS